MKSLKKIVEKIKDYTPVVIISSIMGLAHYGGGTDFGGAVVIGVGYFVVLALVINGAARIIKALSDDYKR